MKGVNSITVKANIINAVLKHMERNDFKPKDIDRVVLIKDGGAWDETRMTLINVIGKNHSCVSISFPTEADDEN